MQSGKLILTKLDTEKLHIRKNAPVFAACLLLETRLEYVKVLPDDGGFPAGTILTGRVQHVVPNIPAAFVALDKQGTVGFLSLKGQTDFLWTDRKGREKLAAGDELLVQVKREAIKTKEITLTGSVELTGAYCLVKQGTGRLSFSKKLSRETKAVMLQYLIQHAVITREQLLIGYSGLDVIVRTRAETLVPQRLSELEKDMQDTAAAYKELLIRAQTRAAFTVHQKPVGWLEEIRTECQEAGFSIGEYISDDQEIVRSLKEQLPEKEADAVRFYEDSRVSLYTLYGLQGKLSELLQKKVWLPGGGYLMIEPTEAMTVIDVNSGKAVKGTSEEKLYFDTNMEACREALRQIRLRNISGIIVIDFINMKDRKKEQEILLTMKEKIKEDYSKVTVYDFTKLGLLELTRNKKSRALHELL